MYREIPWIVHFPVDSPVPTAKHKSAWRTGSYLHLGSYWKYEISSNPRVQGKTLKSRNRREGRVA